MGHATDPSFLSSAVPVYRLHQGTAPLLISIPHMGVAVPDELKRHMTPEALKLPDTDWHLDKLYEMAVSMGASVLQATHSRYVIDLNRPPDNANLYPGLNTTSLCPVDLFDGSSIYLSGLAPEPAEIEDRILRFWLPYHQQLQAELTRLHQRHGGVVVWDAHSIRSVVPRFFDGRLPDFNFGTGNGVTCNPDLAQRLLQTVLQTGGTSLTGPFTAVLNGRFKGGHITRHYGQPERNIHTIQLELSQCTYMDESWPFTYRPDEAVRVQAVLQRLLQTCLAHMADR